MTKKLIKGNEALHNMCNGVSILNRFVSATMGARGKNIAYEDLVKGIFVTKDGVTVAKQIEVLHRPTNMGIKIARESADRSAREAGDGTTTAIVLTNAILQKGKELVLGGCHEIQLTREIEEATNLVLEELKKSAIPVTTYEEIYNVAMVSSNHDEKIAKIVADCLDEAGNDASITIENAEYDKDSYKIKEGFTMDAGYFSPVFLPEGRTRIALDSSMLFVTDNELVNFESVVNLINVAKYSGKPLIIVCKGVKEAVMSQIEHARNTADVNVQIIKAPQFGRFQKEILHDLSIFAGCNFYRQEDRPQVGFATQADMMSFVGNVDSVLIEKNKTSFGGGWGDKKDIKARITQIDHEIKATGNHLAIEHLEKRKRSLVGVFGVIYVGAITDPEKEEKKDRYEDALLATQCAMRGGIVAGGGTALLKAQKVLRKSDKMGFKVVADAIEAPYKTICKNAGIEGGEFINKIKNSKLRYCGVDVLTGKFVNDMMKHGIVDPHDVTFHALRNASSCARIILGCEGTITIDDVFKEQLDKDVAKIVSDEVENR